MLLFLRLYFLLQKCGFIKRKPIKNVFLLNLRKITRYLLVLLTRTLEDIYRLIFKYVASFDFLILTFARYLETNTSSYKQKRIVFIFDILPKVFMVILFLTEVFVYKKIQYYYSFLWVLLVPIIFLLIKKTMIHYFKEHEPLHKKLYRFTEKNYTYCPFEFVPGYTPPGYIKGIEDFLINYVLPVKRIKHYIEISEIITRLFAPINVFIIIGYLIGWFRILLSLML
jgi:hypothetical protein